MKIYRENQGKIKEFVPETGKIREFVPETGNNVGAFIDQIISTSGTFLESKF